MKKTRDPFRTIIGDWLNGMGWTHIATLTFRFGTPPEDAMQRTREFIDAIAPDEVECFIAIERNMFGNCGHVHCLLKGLKGLRSLILRVRWENQYGRLKIERFNPKLGGAYYFTKFVKYGYAEWDLRVRSENPKESGVSVPVSSVDFPLHSNPSQSSSSNNVNRTGFVSGAHPIGNLCPEGVRAN